MITEAVMFSRRVKGQDAVYKTYAKPSPLLKFRHFIEHSDWDEVLAAQGARIDILCGCVLISAALYFAPIVWEKLFLG